MNTPYYRNNVDTPTIPLPNPGEGGSVNPDGGIPVTPLPGPGEGGPVDPSFGQPGDHVPIIPLPNPGEGGPIDPSFGQPGDHVPIIPLPNPGEGGPIDPSFGQPGDHVPIIPLPNPGEGGPIDPSFGQPGDHVPVIPLPNPGEGGPVDPGPWTSIITVYPRPIIPCFFCNSNRSGNIRFLNASTGYNPFQIFINSQLVVNALDHAQVSQYGRVSAGLQTITVSSLNGYVYIQKQVRVTTGSSLTVAIINRAGGLDLTVISDVPCATPFNTSCFRTCNLSYNSGALDIMLNNGFVSFTDVRYTEVTPFVRIQPGRYLCTVSRSIAQPTPVFGTTGVLISSYINVQPGNLYTLYVFNWNSSQDALRILVVEDRK